MPLRTVLALVAALLLVACGGGRPDGGALIATLEPAPGTTEHALLVATTREREPGTPAMFSGERASGVDFAAVTVSIPPVHEPGEIEWPKRAPGNPATDFVARSTDYLDDAGFRARLKAAVAARPKGDRIVGVFVHGYNTDFDEGVYRTAQMIHDNGFEGVPVLFTWASRGELVDYVYDRDSATVARDSLEQTLQIAAESGADGVFLFAHSMGNWVALEALRQAKIAGHGDFGGKLQTVILASPDVDVDVFKTQMRRLGVPKRPFLMFGSSDDRALALSSFISGDKPRLGAYTADTQEIADLGVIVIDLSKLESQDPTNHAKFTALAPDFVQNLRRRLAAGDELTTGDEPGLTSQAGALGSSIGGLIGTTAGIAITLPTAILTAPLRAIGGR